MSEAGLFDWASLGRALFLGGWALGFLLALLAGAFYRKPGVSFSEMRLLLKGPEIVFQRPGVYMMHAAYSLGILGTVAFFMTGAGRPPDLPPGESEVSLSFRGGKLEGSVLLPEQPRALALLIAGSGPTDRNGNGPGLSTDNLKLLAEALAEAGIASLRTDKRGVGASDRALRDEADLRFEDFVRDQVAWLDWAATRLPALPRVAIGHSEGALIAIQAADRHELAALVTLAGPGQPADRLLARQLETAIPDPADRQRALEILTTLSAGGTVAEVPPSLAPLFRPSAQPYLQSWFALDPPAELARTTLPALIVQGDRDLQVSSEDFDRLAEARSGLESAQIAEMNHILKAAPLDREGNLLTYQDPNLPLAPGLVEALLAFLDRHLPSAAE